MKAYTDNENGDCILSNKVFHVLGMHILFEGQKYKALIVSFGFHLLLLLTLFAYSFQGDIDSTYFNLKEGGAISTIQLQFSSGIGKSQSTSSSNHSQDDGTKTVEDEISEFQNCLSYPPLALEQKLEDVCVYKLSVREDGTLEKIAVVTACRYAVFDLQVRRQLADWHFQYSKGKEFVLPIRFRLDVRD
ncbi:energy transducer TonB [Leptospira sp. 2 VSF19]|uniref:Energy transducer TonB n=1 Tax=Leptospira soteropolitanensis TaxID=2950025 RepID=A0AAW5VF58_9LEPT|nr:energy transducer TonB [Leptospira soteropolitanensis]MCW7491481.1 energy transducer TonB [Leptospira soteropolitanensis]MCW7499065.1 energy transducer TonB [Leptospira soteropolitanensis]MCW7521343.1 energy transducer TonB [Leptospira soteropolitanensis]MCW7525169.1 energy transducer TonB [Leptospira soteropolitanensis]MCW7529036.1 energy transducer TonB [Leptospira soteropolitanensis]